MTSAALRASEAKRHRPGQGERGPAPRRAPSSVAAGGAAPEAWLRPALILPAIVALGLALRLHGLGDRPFWVDEAATFGIARLSWTDFLRHVAWVEANPPAYYALAKLWLALGPAEEWWLRLPSALAGAAAVPVMYLFCRRAFGVRAALAAALLLAVAPAHVRFSQEARNYALLLLAVLGALLAAQALAGAGEGRRGWARAALLALLAAALMALHPTGVIAAAAVFAYAGTALLARRQFTPARLLPLVAAGVGALVLGAPWLLRIVAILADPQSVASWQPPLTAAHAIDGVTDVLLAPYLSRLAPPVAALQLGALALAVALRRREPEFLGCLAALGFALLAFLLIALFIEQILFERTLLFTLAFWIALLAAGIGAIRRPGAVALALLLVLAPQVRGLVNHARLNHYEEVWDALGRRLAEAARPGEALVAIGVFEAVAAQHYLRRAGGAAMPLAVLGLAHEARFLPMARAMLAPRAAWMRPEAQALCAALGTAAGVWVAGREEPGRHGRAALEPRLRALGARRVEAHALGSLRLERWSAPTGCPPA